SVLPVETGRSRLLTRESRDVRGSSIRMLQIGGHARGDRPRADDGPAVDVHHVLRGGMSRSRGSPTEGWVGRGGSVPGGISALTISSNMRRSATEWYLPSNQLSTTSRRAVG